MKKDAHELGAVLDLFGLDGNVYIFKLRLCVIEIVLDITRHVSRPIAGLEVLAGKDNDALIMQWMSDFAAYVV